MIRKPPSFRRRLPPWYSRILHRLFVVPIEWLWFTLGLVDDPLDAAQFRSESRWVRLRYLLRALVDNTTHLLMPVLGVTTNLFWEIAFCLGLVRDAKEASKAVEKGIRRRAMWLFTATIATVVSAIWIGSIDRHDLVPRYRVSAEAALAAEQHDLAELCYERLAQLEPTEPSYAYQLALLVDQQGDHNRAAKLMNGIASPRHAGYAPAHAWIADRLMESPRMTLAEARTAWAHFSHVLAREPGNLSVHEQMSRLLVNLGCMESALPHLEQAAKLRPELSLLLAQSEAARGDTAKAQSHAQLAAEALSEQLAQSPGNESLSVQLADALMLSGQFGAARDVLRDLASNDPSEEVRQKLRAIYVQWAQADWQRTQNLDDYLDRLSAAVHDDRANILAVEQLIAVRRHGGKSGERANRILDSMPFDSIPAEVHVLLGNDALAHNLPIVARRHYEEALRLDSTLPEAGHNLAWLLAHCEPYDLDRSLELIESVVKRFPSRTPLLETRSYVLAQLGRWEEAAHDLETAIFVRENDPALHALLATCYDHLDKAEQAELHRARSKELMSMQNAGAQ